MLYFKQKMLYGQGFVYLLKEDGDEELYKIGVTKGDINARIKKLQTGNGNKIRLVHSFLSDRPFKLERMLHQKYKENREEGEWFLLDKKEVDNFLNECQRLQEIINCLNDNPFF